jgi:hypothetical protein
MRGKKVKSRERHIPVGTLGLLFPFIERIYGDGGY